MSDDLTFNKTMRGIAKLIRWRRQKLAMTQKELAETAGIGLRTVEQMENENWMGEGHSVYLANFFKVLQALEVRIQFMDGQSGMDLTGKYAGLPLELKIEEMKKELG